jgi:hypothetical protein
MTKHKKPKFKLTREYRSLVARVRKIDKEAADYMLYSASALPCFVDDRSLVNSFAWDDTPQGHSYWSEIFTKLGEM